MCADTTPPTVTSIVRLTPAGQLTNAATVTFRATFSENVNNVSAADFSVVDVSSSIVGESITSVSASNGTTIDVTINTGTAGTGDLRVDVPSAETTIEDDAGNLLATSYTTGQTYTSDHTLPTVTSTTPSLAGGTLAEGASSLQIVFSEAILEGPQRRITSSKASVRTRCWERRTTHPSRFLLHTMEIRPPSRFPLTPCIPVTISDAIADVAGNRLDGNGDGIVGGNDVADFDVLQGENSLFYPIQLQFGPGGSQPLSLVGGDFNGDAIEDLAVANGAIGGSWESCWVRQRHI